MPEPSMIPHGSMPKASFGLFAPSEMMSFPTLSARGEGSTASRPIAHPELIVSQFSESPAVQHRLSLDQNEISDGLSAPWTVESALANSIELPNVNLLRSTSKRSLNMSPMKGSNYSVESHDVTGGWGVDVEGLREALGKPISAMKSAQELIRYRDPQEPEAGRDRNRKRGQRRHQWTARFKDTKGAECIPMMPR